MLRFVIHCRSMCNTMCRLFLLMPHDVCRLRFASEHFSHPHCSLRDRPAAHRQKYISGRVLGAARKIDSDILPSFLIIFVWGGGGQKWEIWPRFLTPVAFEVLWFRNATTLRKSKTYVGRTDDFSKYCHGCFVHPSAIFTGVTVRNLASIFRLWGCGYQMEQRIGDVIFNDWRVHRKKC